MILIFPWARAMRNGKENPKNYPYWPEVIDSIKGNWPEQNIVQLGVAGERQLTNDFRKNLSIADLTKLINECDAWLGVDSFPQHLGWLLNKPGIAIWGQSDPKIFGHPENINLLKDEKYLRATQFWWWEQAEFNADAFAGPDVVIGALTALLKLHKE